MTTTVDPFGPGILLASFILIVIWIRLARRNLKNENIGYFFGCVLMFLSFAVAFVEFVFRFYITTADSWIVLVLLSTKMFLFVAAGITFSFVYKPKKLDENEQL